MYDIEKFIAKIRDNDASQLRTSIVVRVARLQSMIDDEPMTGKPEASVWDTFTEESGKLAMLAFEMRRRAHGAKR